MVLSKCTSLSLTFIAGLYQTQLLSKYSSFFLKPTKQNKSFKTIKHETERS